VALGVPGRLRPRIISTFGTTRVVGRQPYVPATFTPGEIPGTHFQRLSRPQGTWFCRKEPWKKSPVTSLGIDRGTVRLVAHYATPGPVIKPNRCTNFPTLICHETQHVSDSSSVHHQEFIPCTLSNGICRTTFEQDQDGTAVPSWSCSTAVYKPV
jgi:hypothetical protein